MSVLTQAFLTLVRSHLMSLMLLSVRHNNIVLKGFLLADLVGEGKQHQVPSRDGNLRRQA